LKQTAGKINTVHPLMSHNELPVIYYQVTINGDKVILLDNYAHISKSQNAQRLNCIINW